MSRPIRSAMRSSGWSLDRCGYSWLQTCVKPLAMSGALRRPPGSRRRNCFSVQIAAVGARLPGVLGPTFDGVKGSCRWRARRVCHSRFSRFRFQISMPKLRLCIHGNRDTLPILMQRLRAAGLARPAADDLPGYHDLLSGLAIWAAAARGNRIQVSSPQLVQRPSLRKTRVNA